MFESDKERYWKLNEDSKVISTRKESENQVSSIDNNS